MVFLEKIEDDTPTQIVKKKQGSHLQGMKTYHKLIF
jgi:hypothetical protein